MDRYSAQNRKCIFNAGLIPNIKENPRNRKTPKRGRKRFFNAAIHVLRMRVERTFTWEDKFKRLLLRFERIQQRHYGMKVLGLHVDQSVQVLRHLKLATSYMPMMMIDILAEIYEHAGSAGLPS